MKTTIHRSEDIAALISLLSDGAGFEGEAEGWRYARCLEACEISIESSWRNGGISTQTTEINPVIVISPLSNTPIKEEAVAPKYLRIDFCRTTISKYFRYYISTYA